MSDQTWYFRRNGRNGDDRLLLVARLRPDWYDQLEELHRRGYSDRAIARALGKNPTTVFKARRRLELEPNTRPGGQAAVDVVHELAREAGIEAGDLPGIPRGALP